MVEVGEAREKRPRGGPLGALAVVVAVVVGLSVWGLAVAPGPAPTSPPVVPASAVPPTVLPATVALPSDDGSGLPSVTVPTDDEAFASLAASGGWPMCPMWSGLGDGSTLTAAEVVAQLANVRDPHGMYQLSDPAGRRQRVWVAADPDDAARGFGGSAVVRVPDEGESVWTGVPGGAAWTAIRVEPVAAVGSGRLAWQVRDSATPAPYCIFDSGGGQPADVVRVAADGDPVARLMTLGGWYQCRGWQRLIVGATVSGAAIDAAADAAGVGDGPGWLRLAVPGTAAGRDEPVWIGEDAAVAGTRHGTRTVVIAGDGDQRSAWMAMSLDGAPLAVGFDLVRTPAGRTAWLPTENAAGVTGNCDLGGDAPAPAGDGTAGGNADTTAVEVLRGGDTAVSMLEQRLAWTGCRMTSVGRDLRIPGGLVDIEAMAAGVDVGAVIVHPPGSEPVVAVLTDDVVELARASGRPFVALDPSGHAWVADTTRADEMVVERTPGGRTAWVPTGAGTWPDACLGPATASAPPTGIRSLTCWTDHDRCAEAVETARATAPAAFGSEIDVAAGLGDACAIGTVCPWDGPNQPVYVTAVPWPWRSADQLRAFAVGPRRLSGASGELDAAAITAAILAEASRPSLALPVGPDEVLAACPATGIEARLRAAPWDQRVAWLGDNTIEWPPGTSVRFVPDAVVVARDGLEYHEGDLVQASGTSGVEGGFQACHLTRVESAAPLPSAP